MRWDTKGLSPAQPPFLGWLDVKWQTFRDGESIIIIEVEKKQEMGL